MQLLSVVLTAVRIFNLEIDGKSFPGKKVELTQKEIHTFYKKNLFKLFFSFSDVK